jgi:outer membrane receptor protein involved in Fe transport
VFNGRITYRDTKNSWSASFQVTNLFNKFYWQQLSSTTSQITGLPNSDQAGTPSRPREWSFSIRKEF